MKMEKVKISHAVDKRLTMFLHLIEEWEPPTTEDAVKSSLSFTFAPTQEWEDQERLNRRAVYHQ